MRVSRKWLQKHIVEELPSVEVIAERLTMSAFEIEEIVSDDVFDVKILPDRAHYALSHYGVAMDVATAFNYKLKARKEISLSKKAENFEIQIDDPRLCRRYMGAIIREVKVGPSPEWLRVALEAIGQRSINNIVDAANYVMFDVGQPLHAFDLAKLTRKDGLVNIHINSILDDQKFLALDNKEYDLKKGTLAIVNGNTKTTLAIAGVKGGAEAGVTESTTDLVLESANFDPVTVRKTGRGLGLVTDAQKRFENEITPELAERGLSDLIDLIIEIAGGKLETIAEIYPKPVKPYKVGVSLREINQVLGTNLKAQEVEDIVVKFGLEHKCITPHEFIPAEVKKFLGKPYKWGASVLYDAPEAFDCSSLSSYLYKEAGVQIPRVVADQYIYGEIIEMKDLVPGDIVFSRTKRRENKIHTETIEFMKGTPVPDEVSHLGVYIGDNKVIHACDPEGVIEEEISTSSRFQEVVGCRRMAKVGEKRWVVTVPAERLDLRIKEDLIEEIGRIYGYEHVESKIPEKVSAPAVNQNYVWVETLRSQFVDSGYSEVYTYALRDKGEVELENPLASDKAYLRSNLSDGVRESLELNKRNKDLLGLKEIKIFEIGNVFVKGKEETHVCFANEKEVIEMTLEEAVKHMKIEDVKELPEYAVSENKFKPISIYPYIVRDIAVWIPDASSPEEIISIVKEFSGDLLMGEPKQFDKFSKDGKTSYAYRMIYQSMDRTLTIEEVNEIMQKITDKMNSNSNWQVR